MGEGNGGLLPGELGFSEVEVPHEPCMRSQLVAYGEVGCVERARRGAVVGQEAKVRPAEGHIKGQGLGSLVDISRDEDIGRPMLSISDMVEAEELSLGVLDAEVGIQVVVDEVSHTIVAGGVPRRLAPPAEEMAANGEPTLLGVVNSATIGDSNVTVLSGVLVCALGALGKVASAWDGEVEVHEDHETEDPGCTEALLRGDALGKVAGTIGRAIEEPGMVLTVA